MSEMQRYSSRNIFDAAKNGDLGTVRYLIENGTSADVKNDKGETPLHYAALNGHLNVVRYLIDNKHVSVNDKDYYNHTSLHFAALNGHLNVVRYLVDEKNADFNMKNGNDDTPLHKAAENGYLDVVKYLIGKKHGDFNVRNKQLETPLHRAAWAGRLDVIKYLVDEKHADINVKDKRGFALLDYASWNNGFNDKSEMVSYLESKGGRHRTRRSIVRGGIPEHSSISSNPSGDHKIKDEVLFNIQNYSMDQPEIATSSGAKPSSWINDLLGWVKSSVSGLLSSKPESTPSSISQVDARVDVNGTIMLLDILIRKVTGQKYISTADQSISPLEAQGYALNITKGFEKVVGQAGLKSGVSIHRLNIDYMGMQKEITRKVMSGKFNEISGVLGSYVEKACPGREAGKLSEKKFDKFMAKFNKGLDVIVNQSIEQILHKRDDKLEVDGAKQMSLEPQSYLSNASVQGHLTRNKVKLIS
ncbi:ankyrin repeat domain-containing protein [Wolbachia pipientis]|uniref:ankyrin repeat domain-containing protein n=1 Tax=Wolbachia pipientis TaxID=955 RepID=UPI0020B77A33|nr:ankyrin repeat domain-containing protein [Wolbachia pipientis]